MRKLGGFLDKNLVLTVLLLFFSLSLQPQFPRVGVVHAGRQPKQYHVFLGPAGWDVFDSHLGQ